MTDQVLLKPGKESDAELDEELRSILAATDKTMWPVSERGGGEDWDGPFDLRVAMPRAVDLRTVWAATNAPIPEMLAGALGPKRPILVSHVVTPFPIDGRSPARVWGLGYEFVAHGIAASTAAVTPSDEVYKVADIGQTMVFGIDANGKFAATGIDPSMHAGLCASTSQRFQFEVSLSITLRKVVGAPVGTGGAQWKMFRQNEPLDRPHTLLQLLLVPNEAIELACTVKTWAKQAGRFGTSWGAKFWPYEDQAFTLKLL